MIIISETVFVTSQWPVFGKYNEDTIPKKRIPATGAKVATLQRDQMINGSFIGINV